MPRGQIGNRWTATCARSAISPNGSRPSSTPGWPRGRPGGRPGGCTTSARWPAAFHAYIAKAREDGFKGPDHSTAGAREAERLYGPALGRLLAYAIAGHHAGLADWADLQRRLDPAQKALDDYAGWEAHTGALPAAGEAAPKLAGRPNAHAGFSQAFLTRMLLSCLVDADFLATERFYARIDGREPEWGAMEAAEVQQARLSARTRA
jgi:CRISPR-associated endonuclease/helicase Cas3